MVPLTSIDLERRPPLWRQFFNLNGINDILHNGVGSRGVRLSVQVMLHFANSDNSVFFEDPLGQGSGQGLVRGGNRFTTDTLDAERLIARLID